MEDRQRVFIKGILGRGKEVIATLVNFGAKDYFTGGDGNNPNDIYFIRHNGNIGFVEVGSKTAKILEDYYKEVKLPEQWKDGDILIRNDGAYYKVFSDYDPDNVNIFHAYSMSISINDGTITYYNEGVWVCDIKDYRLATSEEIEHFYDILHKKNKDWDAKKKQVVDMKWKPKNGETYWVVYGNGRITSLKWEDFSVGTDYLDFGNCFKTREEAEFAAKKIKKLLKGE